MPTTSSPTAISNAGLEDSDHLSAIEAGVLDLQPERPRDQTALLDVHVD
jgi:hypothetical protein